MRGDWGRVVDHQGPATAEDAIRVRLGRSTAELRTGTGTAISMSLAPSGDDRIVEQIVKQLNKLIDVIKVVDLNESEFVSRETALIKVHTKAEDRAEALRIADIFRANVIDSTPTTYTIEVTGDPKKIEAIINLLQPLGIKELIRTGRVG